MAFGEIKNTEQSAQSFTRYIGIMPVKVLAVNPNKKELSEIYGREFTEEPVYVGEMDYEHPTTKQVSKIKTCRIDFIIGNEELDFKSKVSFFLADTPFVSNDGTKCLIIDKYGRTAWATIEQFKNKQIPEYKNGPAKISADYTTCMKNQDKLIEFLKYYFGIPEVMKFNNNTWTMVDDPSNCEVYLEKIKDYFKGDVSEIKKAVAMASQNKVKVLVGVKIVEGKTYQDIFIDKFMRNNATSTRQLEEALKRSQDANGYQNTLFNVGEVTIWDGQHPNIKPQNSESTEVVNPFAKKEVTTTESSKPAEDLPF